MHRAAANHQLIIQRRESSVFENDERDLVSLADARQQDVEVCKSSKIHYQNLTMSS